MADEPIWTDPRVAAGMRRQLAWRRERLAAGERPIGWKIGLGSPQALAAAAITAPLVGFLTDRVVREPGVPYSLAGSTKPALESEIGIHVGAPVPPGADRTTAAAAIAGLGIAIELADVDRPLADVEEVLAGNIFNRAVLLGPVDTRRAGGDTAGLSARLLRDGAEIHRTDDLAALVGGDPVDLVRHVASYLSAFDLTLDPGAVVISGSVVPLEFVSPGQELVYELGELGSLSVTCVGLQSDATG
jgi:2-keto-4-pentenoate hydratase